jgi:cobalt-zinc-cadmium efflux system membrane fusion protein
MQRKHAFRTAFFLSLGVAALIGLYAGVLKWDSAYGSRLVEADGETLNTEPALVKLCPTADTIQVSSAGLKTIGLQTVEVGPAPPPEPLRLPGSLKLDTDRMVHVHARFPGELVRLGTTVNLDRLADGAELPEERPLRFGDIVAKGQILGVVWSKDIGEKKSELVGALSQMKIDLEVLTKLEKVEKGIVPEPRLQEARGNFEADLIAIDKADRTLKSWKLTDQEIQDIRQEAKRIQQREMSDPQAERTWAETEVRSPINGIIVEKNANEGAMIDPAQDMFKIADLGRVQVLATAYEEELPTLRRLRPDQRKWKIDFKSDPGDESRIGTFEIIGNIIDPAQHAGAVMGWLDNSDGRLSIGEFITATIELPADPTLVTVPTSAVIEDGSSSKVFVQTSAERHEFECRKVSVARRGRKQLYVRSEPTAADQAAGAQGLKVGERVVQSGVLELAAEMKGLQATAHER